MNAFYLLGAVLLLSAGQCVSFSLGGRIVVPKTRKFRAGATKPYGAGAGSSAEGPVGNVASMKRLPWSKHTEEEKDKMEEEAVDEYLEFLDRRYRRLHDDEETSRKPVQPVFSAWNWLKQEEVTDAVTSQRSQEDALYVLGVAGLASKKLLQKHQMPVSQPSSAPRAKLDETSNRVDAIDVPVASPIDSMTPISKASVLVQAFMKRFAYIAALRRSLHSYQNRKVLQLAKTAMRAPARLTKKLWKIGGGKRNIAVSFTVAIALTVFLIRPIVQFIGQETMNVIGA